MHVPAERARICTVCGVNDPVPSAETSEMAVAPPDDRLPAASDPADATSSRPSDGVRLRARLHALLGIVSLITTLACMAGAAWFASAGIGLHPVLSGSMAPAFEVGDLAVTRPVPVDELAVGDVAVLPVPETPGVMRMHRITEIGFHKGARVYQTKGDANATVDDGLVAVTSETVPVAQRRLPGAAWVATAGANPMVRVGLILFAGSMAMFALWRTARNGRRYDALPEESATAEAVEPVPAAPERTSAERC